MISKIIGVVGGAGPYAGLDLVHKIFDHTLASTDQEHLPVALLSYPGEIPDRSAFLLGKSEENPGIALAHIVRQLESLGASVVGIPCHTAHAPLIFDSMKNELAREGSRAQVLHIAEQTALFVMKHFPSNRRLGILSTTGTRKAQIYSKAFQSQGIAFVEPSAQVQENVHRAIYDPNFGIKAKSNPVTSQARQMVLDAIAALKAEGSEAVVLACTELPLAIAEKTLSGIAIIDPTVALARALIEVVNPKKLRPFD